MLRYDSDKNASMELNWMGFWTTANSRTVVSLNRMLAWLNSFDLHSFYI